MHLKLNDEMKLHSNTKGKAIMKIIMKKIKNALFVSLVYLLTSGASFASYDDAFGFSDNNNYNSLQLTTITGDTFSLPYINQGWWEHYYGYTNSNQGSYNVMYYTNAANPIYSDYENNFFTFDLSSLSGKTIANANLNIIKYEVFSDTKNYVTYSLYDVSTSAAALIASSDPSNTIFSDLQSGKNYGAYDLSVNVPLLVSTNISYDKLNLTLNSNAISDINYTIANSDKYFSIGGTLAPVPVPAAVWLFGSALGAIGFFNKRRMSNPESCVAA